MLLFCLGMNNMTSFVCFWDPTPLSYILSFAKHSTGVLLDIGKSPLPDSDYSENS